MTLHPDSSARGCRVSRTGVGCTTAAISSRKELRKADNRSMTNVIRSLPGIRIDCARSGSPAHKVGECWAVASRTLSKYAILGGSCEVEIYVDGIMRQENDLEKFRVNDYAA